MPADGFRNGSAQTNGGNGSNGAAAPLRTRPFLTDRPGGGSIQYCTFEVVDLLVGIDVRNVQEVIRHQVMAPVPLAPPGVCGLINLRGQIVTALDLRTRLGLPPRPPGVRAMNAVVRHRDEVVSLMVDRTRDVVTPPEEQFEPVPQTVSAGLRSMCTGTYKLDGRLLLVLNVDAILRLPTEATPFKYPDWVAGLDVEEVLRHDGN